MLDSGLLSKNFIGRDGFIWWIGQVPDAKFWKGNLPSLPQNAPTDLPGFKYRVKVRILGYHTSNSKELPDDDLPWALVMLPTTAGSGSGSNAVTPRFSGGEFVFGFFLDGDNGQQPVIIGLLGNSAQTLLSKSLPSVGFKPFTGHTNGKQNPSHSLRTSNQIEKERIPNSDVSIPTGSKGGALNVTVSGTIPNSNSSPNTEGSNSTGDIRTQHAEFQQKNNKEFPLGSACKKDDQKKSKIKSAIKNLIRSIQGIQKSYNSYVAPTVNQLENISSEISLCAGLITGYLQDLLKTFRSWIFNEIGKRLKKLISKTTTKKQIEAGDKQQKVIDTIGCIFDRIINGLLDLIINFLERMIDRLLTAADCIIDNMIGSLLNSIVGPLENAISSALGPLNQFLSGFPGGLDQALNFSTAIERFLSCEEQDQCPEIEIWSWLDGPKPGTEDNFTKELQKVGSTISTALSNLLGNNPSVLPTAGSLEECLTGFDTCGPPNIQIFGGGGSGATANAIIGPSGEILAASILSSGIDYYSNPFVYFDDPCGNGSGAKAEAIVDCGKLIGIKVIDGGKGYLKRSNGSLGSSGKTIIGVGSDANAVVLPNGSNFKIDFNTFGFDKLSKLINVTSGISTDVLASGIKIPCGIKTSYPSIPICIRPNQTVGVGSTASIILSPSLSPLTPDCKNIKSENTYTFLENCKVTIPGISTSMTQTLVPTSPTDDYKVAIELDDIIIKNTGINYSLDDKICITPDNGANLVPQFDPYGRLINVRILNKGTFVTERPTITICNSETGVNAEMFAVLKAKEITKEEIQRYGYDPGKLVSVVNCVGKV